MLNDQDLVTLRTALLAELAQLSDNQDASTEDRATVTLDQQSVGRLSRMDALQRQAMAQATARRRQGREARIHAALKRIDADEYGFCQDCGEDIGLKRLTLDPTLATCVTCARG
ncbi:MAG: TraR/DksA C4-type zinc finger protein [Pseudomonadota bacterium]